MVGLIGGLVQRLEHLPYKQQVPGSSPGAPTNLIVAKRKKKQIDWMLKLGICLKDTWPEQAQEFLCCAAFEYASTYGIPVEVTEESLLEHHDIILDMSVYEKIMEAHKEKSRDKFKPRKKYDTDSRKESKTDREDTTNLS